MNNITKFKKSIIELIDDFQKNPFNHLYEYDLQSALYSKAIPHFESEKIRMVGGYHPEECYTKDMSVWTIPVKREYPGSKQFDIAIIDAGRVEPYDADRWKKIIGKMIDSGSSRFVLPLN